MKRLADRLIAVVTFLALVAVVVWGVWLVAGRALPESEQAKLPGEALAALQATPTAQPLSPPPPERVYFVRNVGTEAILYRADFVQETLQLANIRPVINTGLTLDKVGKLYLSPNKQLIAIEVRTEQINYDIWNLVTRQKLDLRVNGEAPYDLHFLDWTADSNFILAQVGQGIEPGFWRINVLADSGHLLYDGIAPYGRGMISAGTSPDNSTILYSFTRGLGQGSEMWAMNYDGSNRHLLLDDDWHVLGSMRYSPDGERVAYISLPDGASPFTLADLWLMNADGSQPTLLSQRADGGHGYAPAWSSDDHTIAFVTRENPTDSVARREADKATNNIHLADADTGQTWPLLPLTSQHNYYPYWSPDGQALIFVSDKTGLDGLWYIKADGSSLQPLLTPNQPVLRPIWTVGLSLVFLPGIFRIVTRQEGAHE